MQITERLQEIFRDIFDDEELAITAETMSEDIEYWDSLANIQIMVAVSKAFGIKFTTQEITRLKNVGEMQQLIDDKLKGKGEK